MAEFNGTVLGSAGGHNFIAVHGEPPIFNVRVGGFASPALCVCTRFCCCWAGAALFLGPRPFHANVLASGARFQTGLDVRTNSPQVRPQHIFHVEPEPLLFGTVA